MLTENGIISLILPTGLSSEADFIVATNQAYIIRRTTIVHKTGSTSKRFIVEISQKSTIEPVLDTLYLENENRKRTEQYLNLTQDFYL
jgi:tRNA1(Val) A37 N6-methylase TrmN6